jgi:hypothetical protein
MRTTSGGDNSLHLNPNELPNYEITEVRLDLSDAFDLTAVYQLYRVTTMARGPGPSRIAAHVSPESRNSEAGQDHGSRLTVGQNSPGKTRNVAPQASGERGCS